MLPPKYRLSLRKEWPRLRTEGKVYQGPLVGIILGKKDCGQTQFGFIVSRKVSPKATVRNRAKRLLREAVWQFLPQVKPGWQAVILGRKTLVGKNLKEVVNDLEKLFKKSKLL